MEDMKKAKPTLNSKHFFLNVKTYVTTLKLNHYHLLHLQWPIKSNIFNFETVPKTSEVKERGQQSWTLIFIYWPLSCENCIKRFLGMLMRSLCCHTFSHSLSHLSPLSTVGSLFMLQATLQSSMTLYFFWCFSPAQY